ncbi:MAG TPA: FtsX-like permease family protein [Anaeromyxobacter sp.]|jgi:putative ABC transport system permease protein|nr:FtsX-like permease family protein [Anaeromyxobacter sp.]
MPPSPPLLRIAARSVRKNARHSAGSILAIAVGFVALVLFDGYLSYMERDLSDALGERLMVRDVMVERPGAADARESGRPFEDAVLGDREQAFVDGYLAAHASEVRAHARFLYAWGSASTGKASAPFIALGYDVEDGARLRGAYAWDALAGRPLQRASGNAVVLGRGLGARLDCEPVGSPRLFGRDGLPIEEERPFACRRPRVQLVANTASGQLNAIEPEVVGLIDGGIVEYDSKYVNMSMALAQRLLDTRAVSLYVVRLADSSRASAFARELSRAARAQGLDVTALPWMEHGSAEESRRLQNVLGVYRMLVALVVVLIASMSVLTTMAKSVSERAREIGTLRSLGFLRRHVIALFALEAALLAIVGTAIGAALSLSVSMLVNRAGITYDGGLASMPMPFKVSVLPATYAVSAAFLALLAALAAVVPARRVARTRIPDALTHV